MIPITTIVDNKKEKEDIFKPGSIVQQISTPSNIFLILQDTSIILTKGNDSSTFIGVKLGNTNPGYLSRFDREYFEEFRGTIKLSTIKN